MGLFVKKWATLLLSLLFSTQMVANTLKKDTTESQPQILFEYDSLQDSQEKTELLIKFNTAVLYLEQEKYLQAIALLKDSAKLLKVPSYLNIGIAYYKLGSIKNAYLYLRKIYDFKDLKFNDKYSYFSAAYYLYKITGDRKYIEEVTKVSSEAKRLSDHEKLLVIDTLILQGKYQYALDFAHQVPTISKLKLAMLYIKLNDHITAKAYLEQAYEQAKGDKFKNQALWIQLFNALQANDLKLIVEKITKIDERKRFFHTNSELPMELFFNKKRYTPEQYFRKITNFEFDRKLDFIYYFAPFIFEDQEAIGKNETRGFIIKSKKGIEQLNTMIDYNAKFLQIIKKDPIQRVVDLEKMLENKYDTKAYKYYNLGLMYAQIYDYKQAYKNFKKAYSLEHGNKLYSTMTYFTLKKLNIFETQEFKDRLLDNILSDDGRFVFLGKYIYKIMEDPGLVLDKQMLSFDEEKSIFFRSLYFLSRIEKNGIKEDEPLLVEYPKDPLVYLLTLLAKKEGENQYLYLSRLQDEIPKVFNHQFLKGSLVITDFYLDALHALGLFYTTDFDIPNETTPSYLRTKAIIDLYNDKGKSTIEQINTLQKNYNLQSTDSYYILAAAYLHTDQKQLAYITLSEIELIYNDRDAKFLSGIRLIQDLKTASAPQYFYHKLQGKLIDFRIIGFDDFLESL
jgi:hypothetical protein